MTRPSYNTESLKHPDAAKKYQSHLDDMLLAHGPLTGDPSEKWNQFKQLVTETAETVLGPKQRSHQDWFDENNQAISKLLDEKRTAFIKWQNDISSISKKNRFKHLQSKAQRELRMIQDDWWARKADEVQHYADSNNSKMFFSSIKAVYGPPKPSTTPLLASDGTTLLKDKDNITERWREHFASLLNRPSTVDPAALDQIPQNETLYDLDLLPTIDEIRKAIRQTSAGKASGMDGIPAELYKEAGPKTHNALHDIFASIWETETMPAEFRDATIVSLFKNKGNKADCGNYRGISLLSIAGKILARVILNRLINSISEENLPEAQCGFRPGRSTVDMVFTVRQIQEKCIEQRMHLYAVFIDLTKAFDTVNREALWVILAKLGCPRKFIEIIRLFHDGMTGTVLANGDSSASFNITNGVKQGCVLAPVLFNLFFSCVLNHALRDIDKGIYLRYRLDGSLFDLRRLNAKTKTIERIITEALFADDCALMAHRESDLQFIVSKFAKAAQLFGLTISISKTEVVHQPAPGTAAPPPSIHIDNTLLQVVDSFKYLGSVISSDGSLDKEISTRISKANQALGRLRVRVLNNHNTKLSTKLSVYKAVVLSCLLYGCETWTLYRRHIRQLEKFHMRSLRSIMGIRWQDRVTNLEVLDRSGFTSIEAQVLGAQLRWTGHVIRMDVSRMPRQLLYGTLSEGHRSQGRPKKRFKDCIKDHLQYCRIPPKQLEARAGDRIGWRAVIKETVSIFENQRQARLTRARERRKAATLTPSAAAFMCPHCPRVCGSRIGLLSHTRTHQNP